MEKNMEDEMETAAIYGCIYMYIYIYIWVVKDYIGKSYFKTKNPNRSLEP